MIDKITKLQISRRQTTHNFQSQCLLMISFEGNLADSSRVSSPHELLAASDLKAKKIKRTHSARVRQKNAIENNLKLHSLNQLQPAVSPMVDACVWS